MLLLVLTSCYKLGTFRSWVQKYNACSFSRNVKTSIHNNKMLDVHENAQHS